MTRAIRACRASSRCCWTRSSFHATNGTSQYLEDADRARRSHRREARELTPGLLPTRFVPRPSPVRSSSPRRQSGSRPLRDTAQGVPQQAASAAMLASTPASISPTHARGLLLPTPHADASHRTPAPRAGAPDRGRRVHRAARPGSRRRPSSAAREGLTDEHAIHALATRGKCPSTGSTRFPNRRRSRRYARVSTR